MKKDLSLIARKRVGKTKKEVSAKMRELALKRQKKMTAKQKKELSFKMHEARYKKKYVTK